MDDEILFSETQQFRQWWLWLILIVSNGYAVLNQYKLLNDGQQFTEESISIMPIIVTGFTVLVLILLYTIRLETEIKKDGVYVRFFPIHLKFKYYNWGSLIKIYVRQYSPLLEYGGWGIKLGLKGTAYNISGNKGLQLEFLNNKKLLIGTKKPDELTDLLDKLGQTKR